MALQEHRVLPHHMRALRQLRRTSAWRPHAGGTQLKHARLSGRLFPPCFLGRPWCALPWRFPAGMTFTRSVAVGLRAVFGARGPVPLIAAALFVSYRSGDAISVDIAACAVAWRRRR